MTSNGATTMPSDSIAPVPASFFGLARELRDKIYNQLRETRELAVVNGNPEQLEDTKTTPADGKSTRCHWLTVEGLINSLRLVCRQFNVEYSQASAAYQIDLHDNHAADEYEYDQYEYDEYCPELPRYLFSTGHLCLDYLVEYNADALYYTDWVLQFLRALPALQSAKITIGIAFHSEHY